MSTEISANGGASEDKAHQKSFKRKYRKLRHKFKEVMRTSDELFKQEQVAKLAIRRLQEQNNRILDMMLDLNECSQISRNERHNIGSPGRNTPPRFLSPSILATITDGDLSIIDPHAGDNDVEPMGLADEDEDDAVEAPTLATKDESDDSSSTDDEEDDKTPARGGRSEDEEDEAYVEEIREFNYRRGIGGTPPKSVREKMKADAERERKEAEVEAKRAAEEAALQQNIVPNLKHELDDDTTNGLTEQSNSEAPTKQLIVEEYRRGQTPPYLRDASPFFMTYEEEDAFYYEIDEQLGGDLPTYEYPQSPSANKAETDSRNPMSVYNWLRRNEPQVFLQGEEGEKKAGGRGRGGGRKKAEKHMAEGSGDEISPKKSGKGGEAGGSKAAAGAKRKRADTRNGDDGESVRGGSSSRGGRGRGGGRKKQGDSEPAVKRARR